MSSPEGLCTLMLHTRIYRVTCIFYLKVKRTRVCEVRAGMEAARPHASRVFRARGPGTAGHLKATERAALSPVLPGERGNLTEGLRVRGEDNRGRLLCKTITCLSTGAQNSKTHPVTTKRS